MKLATSNKSTIASQGVKGSSGFAISNSAHMFSILSDGLYSDKIAAVLREIGANAMDAHIMADKRDLPFEVKLPSRFDSTFHIKDFGPGLDDQEVRELYTTYGWSSKQNSNEVTGAFGLGSKSPFAYTDSFSICSVKDGFKRVYTAHKDDEGKPVVSLLSEAESDNDWTAGVMVTFAVAPEDVSEFIQKAGLIYRWFKVKPVITGASVNVAMPEFKTVGSNFSLGGTEPRDQVSRVVMANVAYPLNASRLDTLDEVSLAVLGCGVHLFLPTGSVMPTPNREDIQYDKQSRPAIVAALRSAAEEVGKEIYTRVNEQKSSNWEWHRNIQQYAESLPQSIRWKIKQFLALATEDKDELETLNKLFLESDCKVPTWIGDGREAPLIPYKRDAHNNKVSDLATNDFVLDYDAYDGRGCRVWYYWIDRKSRGTNPVKRKEVTNGHIKYASGSDPTALNLSYTDDVIVMVADGARADLRVKFFMDGANKDDMKVLMVQPVRGADAAYANAYAKSMAGETAKGLGGVALKLVSSVELPQAIVERSKSTRLTLEEKRELFREESLTYFSLTDAGVTAQSATVGDFEEDSDKFFVFIRENSRRGGSVSYVTMDDSSQGQYASYDSKDLKTVCQSIAKLRGIEKLEGMTGFFAMRGEQVKNLKLRDAGWKPAFQEISALVKNQEWVDRLAKHVDISPEIHIDGTYYARRSGFPGILASHSKRATPFFGQLKRLMPDHPMVLLANRLAAKHGDGKSSKKDDNSVEMLVAKLNSGLSNACVNLKGLTRLSEGEVRGMALEVYPTLKLLDMDAFQETAENNPELAASLFWQFVNLKAESNPDQVSMLLKIAA